MVDARFVAAKTIGFLEYGARRMCVRRMCVRHGDPVGNSMSESETDSISGSFEDLIAGSLGCRLGG